MLDKRKIICNFKIDDRSDHLCVWGLTLVRAVVELPFSVSQIFITFQFLPLIFYQSLKREESMLNVVEH